MNDTANNTGSLTALNLRALREGEAAGWQNMTVPGGPDTWANPAIGEVVYGRGPLGYDQFLFRVNSGSPVLGYAFIDGELCLTALSVGRPNINDGEFLPEVAGGFAKFDPESGEIKMPKTGALRELFEETGFDPQDVTFADGEPFIGDRAFFYKEASDGNRVFFFELTEEHKLHLRLSPNLKLLHWTRFVKDSADALTLAAIVRVMAALAESGFLKVLQA